MIIMAVLLIVIVYVNEKVIGKLPESSTIKTFWRKHICMEDETHN